MASLVGKDIELDAQTEPSVAALAVRTLPHRQMLCMLVAPLWCDLGCCSPESPTVMLIKAAANPRLFYCPLGSDGLPLKSTINLRQATSTPLLTRRRTSIMTSASNLNMTSNLNFTQCSGARSGPRVTGTATARSRTRSHDRVMAC